MEISDRDTPKLKNKSWPGNERSWTELKHNQKNVQIILLSVLELSLTHNNYYANQAKNSIKTAMVARLSHS